MNISALKLPSLPIPNISKEASRYQGQTFFKGNKICTTRNSVSRMTRQIYAYKNSKYWQSLHHKVIKKEKQQNRQDSQKQSATRNSLQKIKTQILHNLAQQHIFKQLFQIKSPIQDILTQNLPKVQPNKKTAAINSLSLQKLKQRLKTQSQGHSNMPLNSDAVKQPYSAKTYKKYENLSYKEIVENQNEEENILNPGKDLILKAGRHAQSPLLDSNQGQRTKVQ